MSCQESNLRKELDEAYRKLAEILDQLESVKSERDALQKSFVASQDKKIATSHWDHSGKPSVFVVKENGIEIYRGPFNQGYEIYCEKNGTKK